MIKRSKKYTLKIKIHVKEAEYKIYIKKKMELLDKKKTNIQNIFIVVKLTRKLTKITEMKK